MIEIHDDIVLRYGGGAPGYNYPDLLPYAVDKPFLVPFGQGLLERRRAFI